MPHLERGLWRSKQIYSWRDFPIETKQWFLADETEWPYSFECISGVLDLDSNAVRQRLGVTPVPQPAPELRAALFQR